MAELALALEDNPAIEPPIEPRAELTPASIAGGLLISLLLSSSYPFVVLKLGLGTDSSMVAAFLGAIFLAAFARGTRGRNRHQNNIIQTMAGSASATAFMCVVMAAFAYLTSSFGRDVGFNPHWWQVLTWLTCSGCIGVLFVARFRRFFLDHPRMIFASGVAAAAVIDTLDRAGEKGTPEADDVAKRSFSLFGAGGFAALSAVLRDMVKLPMTWTINGGFRVALGFDMLSFGTGLLVTANVGASFILGALILWLGGDKIIAYGGMDASHGQYKAAMLWLMWPASAFMIAASIVSLAINSWKARRRALAAGLRLVTAPPAHEEDIPWRVTIWGTAILAAILVVIQYVNFDVSPVKTLAAVAAQLVLILAGVWVLGETNFGPISLMANGVQFAFGVLWRHDVRGNLIAAGMAGDGNAQAEQVMQAFRTGRILGSTPKAMTIAQLIGVPIGALAVALMFPLLVQRYGIGPNGLSAPTGLKLANMAVLIDKGFAAFPKGALPWSLVAIGLAVVFEVLRNWEIERHGRPFHPFAWVPSPGALGFGLILPPSTTLMMGLGAITSRTWAYFSKDTHERYHQTLAAGLVVGEALMAGLLFPILGALGVKL